MPSTVRLAVAAGALLALAPIGAAAAAPPTTAPRITAHPSSVMVNSTTTLTGIGFQPHQQVHLEECGQITWIVPMNPCDTTNSITVTADRRGHFRTSFTMLTCPAPATPGFAQQCYVGVPTILGVDQIGLRPSVTVTVTGP